MQVKLGAGLPLMSCRPVYASFTRRIRSDSAAPVGRGGAAASATGRGLVAFRPIRPSPPVVDRADDRLPARVDGDVLDPDHLPTLAPVVVERAQQGGVGPHQPARLAQVHLPAL